MKRRKLIILLSVILVVLIICAVFLFLYQNKGEEYDAYYIQTEDAIYCPRTRTGTMEVTVKYKTEGYKKLFATSDDILGDGSKEIVDDEHLLRIVRGEDMFLSRAEEVKSTGEFQKIKVYFINKSGKSGEAPVSLTVCDSKEENVVAKIDTDTKIDEEVIIFGEGLHAVVSSTGVKLNGYSEIQQNFSGDVSLNLKWEDKTKVLVLNQDSSVEKVVNGNEVVVPTLVLNEAESGESRIYVIEIEDWKEIEVALLGDRILKRPEGTEKDKDQEPAKQKERYEEALSQEVVERYDSDVTYEQLMEEPDVHAMKTTMILSGSVERVSDTMGGVKSIDIQTKDGTIIGYVEDKSGTLEIELADEYVMCGQFQGLDPSGVPLFHVIVLKSLEDV